jgi:hypothetical protein
MMLPAAVWASACGKKADSAAAPTSAADSARKTLFMT